MKRLFWRVLCLVSPWEISDSHSNSPIFTRLTLKKLRCRKDPLPTIWRQNHKEPEKITLMPLRVFGRALRAVAKDRKDLDPNIIKPIKATESLLFAMRFLSTPIGISTMHCVKKKTPQTEKTGGLFDKDSPGEAQLFSSGCRVRVESNEARTRSKSQKLDHFLYIPCLGGKATRAYNSEVARQHSIA